MGYVNEAIIVGKLGSDPQLTYTKGGMAVARLAVATNQKYKRGGHTVEETEWHKVVVFGRRGEIAKENLSKGSTIYVKGVKRTSTYTDATGVQRSKPEIIALEMKWPGSEKLDLLSTSTAKIDQKMKSGAAGKSTGKSHPDPIEPSSKSFFPDPEAEMKDLAEASNP